MEFRPAAGTLASGNRAAASRSPSATVRMLLRYKAWANQIAFAAVMAIPEEEALLPRMTTFKNMVHTLNHVYVVDDIFRHHLTDRTHAYTMRNTEETPPVRTLWAATQEMDRWYIELVEGWTADDLGTIVNFEFIGGGRGAMTREEIILHLVNHATYHRGFVGDMLKQVPYYWPANDLTVFLRDHYPRT
jgi:uncharacterized damage-inducible protein DinB